MHVTARLKLLVPEVGTLPMEFKLNSMTSVDSKHSKQNSGRRPAFEDEFPERR
jgi:hypothetical protein